MSWRYSDGLYASIRYASGRARLICLSESEYRLGDWLKWITHVQSSCFVAEARLWQHGWVRV